MNFIKRFLISAIAIVGASYFLPGIHLDITLTTIVFITVSLALLNAVVKPVLIILTIPATILSLGLFLLVINAVIILIADWLVDGFRVDGFLWALLFSLIVSFLVYFIEKLTKTEKN